MREHKIREHKKREPKKSKLFFPISLKLGIIFSVLVVFVLGLSAFMTYRLIHDEEEAKAEENNLTLNSRTALSLESLLLYVQTNANGYLNSLLLLDSDEQFEQKVDVLFSDLITRNEEIIFLYTSGGFSKANRSFERTHATYRQEFAAWLNSKGTLKNYILNGQVCVMNISPVFDIPLICILYSHYNSLTNQEEIVAVAFDTRKYMDIISTGSYNASFLVNLDGDVLLHSDMDKILSAENLSYLKAVQIMGTSKFSSTQNLLPDENGEMWYYAINGIINNNMFVITCVRQKDVFTTINHITYRIAAISLAIFFIAILVIRFFSKTITYPVQNLVEATKKIEKGNYDLGLKVKGHDELSVLTESFTNMSSGLAERHNLMKNFSRFVNKSVAERAAKGELELGGVNKEVTIFFSDIRSFTAMSEKMSAQEVVGLLNKYNTSMVKCINDTHGCVDKFIGDSIMATWGAESSSGSPAQDAWNAVRTALLMRIALYHLNQERIARGRVPIKIGCGINTGTVVAGNIGGRSEDDKMEYTVIGDAVNLASRTEALNKPFATDILITENTYNLVKDKVIVEEMPGVHVKGKEDVIKMYAVINAVGVSGPENIASLRKFLGVATPDLEKVNPDEAEQKYQINTKSN